MNAESHPPHRYNVILGANKDINTSFELSAKNDKHYVIAYQNKVIRDTDSKAAILAQGTSLRNRFMGHPKTPYLFLKDSTEDPKCSKRQQHDWSLEIQDLAHECQGSGFQKSWSVPVQGSTCERCRPGCRSATSTSTNWKKGLLLPYLYNREVNFYRSFSKLG